MDNETLRIHYASVTNLLVVGFIGAAFLMGRIEADTAMIPLLAVSGLEIGSRLRRPGVASDRPSKPVQAPPPAGLVGMLLFLAMQVTDFATLLPV